MILKKMDNNINFEFPVIKGWQANHTFYVSSIKVSELIAFFKFVEPGVNARNRAQRLIEEPRAQAIKRYILENKSSYILPAIVAEIKAKIDFFPIHPDSDAIGIIKFPITSEIFILDGQHRRRGLELAVREDIDLKNESISVLFYNYLSIETSQMRFTDINENAKKPSKSLTRLYNKRSPNTQFVEAVIEKILVFRFLTEQDKSAPSSKSTNIFVYSHLWDAISLTNLGINFKNDIEISSSYWDAIALHLKWKRALDNLENLAEIKEMREFNVSVTATGLCALGHLGKIIGDFMFLKYRQSLSEIPQRMMEFLTPLAAIDWDKTNPDFIGRCTTSDCKMIRSKAAELALFQYLKQCLKIPSNKA